MVPLKLAWPRMCRAILALCLLESRGASTGAHRNPLAEVAHAASENGRQAKARVDYQLRRSLAKKWGR